jgi:hypothetical protein
MAIERTLPEDDPMVSDPALAKELSDTMLEFAVRLDALIAKAQSTCPQEEFAGARRRIGKVMGEMLLAVMVPLYKAHPHLKPSDLEL